jgi:hypothetical protein
MSNQVELQLRLVEDVVHQLKKLAEPPVEEVVTKVLPIIVVMSTIILQKVASFRLGASPREKFIDCTFGPSQETGSIACSGIHFFAQSLRSEFIPTNIG